MLFYLYLSVFINVAGFSMVFPMLPFYAQTFGASPLQIGLLAASHALANFIASPVFGRLSDKLGRRPVLIAGLLGGMAAMILMGLSNSLGLLLLGRISHGLAAAAIMPTARAYVGDVTSKSGRVAAMGRIGAAIASGLLFGPTFSSILIGLGDIKTPFFVAALISLLNALSVIFFLPESLKNKVSQAAIKKGLLNMVLVIKSLRGQSGILFMILFAWAFALSNNQVAFPLLLESRFHLGPEHVGYFFTASALTSIGLQGFMLPTVVRLIGEKITILTGCFLMGVAMVVMAYSPSALVLGLGFILMASGGSFNRPVIEGVISRETQAGQGTTMGLAHSFESLGRVFGPTSGGLFYGLFATLPFIFSSMLLFTLGLLAIALLHIPKLKPSEVRGEISD